MTLRLPPLLAGLLALLVSAFLALAPASAKPTSGGSQLFETVALEHQHHIQLASLENFDYFAKTASECCNATNKTDDVLLLENKYPNSNAPEHPDHPITAGPATDGQRGWMAVEEGQINPATGQVDRPGAFLSDDPITSVEQVRNDLAVRDDWKANPTHVQEYEIVPGTQVQSSTVGPQTNQDGTYLPGGGSQTQVLPQTGQYPSDVLVPVGPAVPIE